MRLGGKVALITGSSQGIGSGIALEFAEEGADVVVNYHKKTDCILSIPFQRNTEGFFYGRSQAAWPMVKYPRKT